MRKLGHLTLLISLLSSAASAQSLQWPGGRDYCTGGLWAYHAWLQARDSCRDPAHGTEDPVKSTLYFHASSGFSESEDPGYHKTCSFQAEERLRFDPAHHWDQWDLNGATGVIDRPGIKCSIQVWKNPPYILKVSDHCPLVAQKSLPPAADSSLWYREPASYPGPPGHCYTADELPDRTPEEREARVRSLLSTIQCPNRMFSPDSSACSADIDWNAEIHRTSGISTARALLSLAYALLYAKQAIATYGSDVPSTQREAIAAALATYRAKLPLALHVLELGLASDQDYRLAEVASVIARL